VERPARRVSGWSSSGDPAGPVLKPDLVAVGSGVLGAVPGGWDLTAGTSVAAATTSGAAALLRSRHPDWSEAEVRSALVTTAHELPGEPVLDAGSGRVVPDANAPVALTYDIAPDDYRAWLTASLGEDLNTPSVLLSRTSDSAERTVTNVGSQTVTFTPRARGFEHHDVLVSPESIRLAPGRSATFTVTVGRTAVPQPDDDGWVTWRSQTGTTTRIPVLISR
ncbi:MAG: S8 family serine peptidase, partial [Nocardioides sp.]